MNILNYFSQIKKRIIKLDNYITNPINNKDINNPFLKGGFMKAVINLSKVLHGNLYMDRRR